MGGSSATEGRDPWHARQQHECQPLLRLEEDIRRDVDARRPARCRRHCAQAQATDRDAVGVLGSHGWQRSMVTVSGSSGSSSPALLAGGSLSTSISSTKLPRSSGGSENAGGADARKWLLPMAATHLPEAWDTATRRLPSHTMNPGRGSVSAAADTKERPDVLSIGKDGKTTFPYSLASHRAFLEAQPDPLLKVKAAKLAPLRLTQAARDESRAS